MIEAHDLVKRCRSTLAVNDLRFTMRPGLVIGTARPGAVPAQQRDQLVLLVLEALTFTSDA